MAASTRSTYLTRRGRFHEISLDLNAGKCRTRGPAYGDIESFSYTLPFQGQVSAMLGMSTLDRFHCVDG